MNNRRSTTPVRIGNVVVGGDAPISLQSMSKTDTRDIPATSRQVQTLADAGCQIVRIAIPDMEAASALGAIRHQTAVPLVADIHFDYRLAIAAINEGAHGLRLNPGNINREDHLKKVVRHARDRDIPIRIGVNAGSIAHDYFPGEPVPERMVFLAMDQIRMLEEMDFRSIKVSLKSSDVLTTIEANRLIADRMSYPLHLGITEAGPPLTGGIRNAIGIGQLLTMGIGDTIRVSLSGEPTLEVEAGREILKSLGLSTTGASLISCPTCGRTTLDVPGIAARVSELVRTIQEPIRVAIMGCVVNGPGECREADIGVAGGDGKVLVYRDGVFAYSVLPETVYETIATEIDRLLTARSSVKYDKDMR